MNKASFYSLKREATLLKVSERTVQRWIEEGKRCRRS